MMRNMVIATMLIGFAGFGSGCRPPPAPPSRVLIRVLDEAKTPIHGAEIASQSEVIAKTNDDGRAEVAVAGKEGESFRLEVRCPKLYKSPNTPLEIRRLDNGVSQAPEYVARCSRLRHSLVVAIKTEGGSNMPILHLGREVARTDQDGSAHVLIEGEVHERVDLTIDTSDPKNAKIHPQNPVASFEITNQDELKVFQQKFTRDAKPVAKVVKRSGPKVF
jgi:hypothetical protein